MTDWTNPAELVTPRRGPDRVPRKRPKGPNVLVISACAQFYWMELGHGIRAQIDLEDAALVRPIRWSLQQGRGRTPYVHGYVGKGRLRVKLHRFLMGATEQQQIDHLDFDGLNNRRVNLRACTHTENTRRQRKHRTYAGRPTSSSWKGVSYRKGGVRTWDAKIRVEGRLLHLGSFKTEEEAALAYNVAALKHFGEFAIINNLEYQDGD